MFELTKAAAAKAKEHLQTADLLFGAGQYAQAYLHAALALEEAAIAGIRLVTEAGFIEWGSPPAWFKLREADLSRPGIHSTRLRLGLVMAASAPVISKEFGSSPSASPELSRQAIEDGAARLAQSVLALREAPSFQRVLRNGQARKEAAMYSSPKRPGDPLPVPPDEAEVRALLEFERPLIRSLDREYPDATEMSKVRGLIQAIFLGDEEGAISELTSVLRRAADEALKPAPGSSSEASRETIPLPLKQNPTEQGG
ncbi:MAG: hypothetical protein WAK40_05435 [Thermoplasmata archaeon]